MRERIMKPKGFILLFTFMVIVAMVSLTTTVRADSTVRFATFGDLKILDPIYTTAAQTIGHGYLIYDTLFAMNSNFEPKPQMVEKWTKSPDGMKYTFTLRKGMKWHDGTPVTAKDAVASLKRWGKKGSDAKAMMERVESAVIIDKLTFELNFKEIFGPVLMVMANPVIPGFIMREKDALTPASEQVKEIIGSGPFFFAKKEWVPGSKIVYKKFKDYVPRNEAADGYAGGKVAKIDRVEWIVIPEVNTAIQALIADEVDMIERVPIDLLPMLKQAQGVVLEVTNKLGWLGQIRINTLHPPFNNPKARQALLMAVNQDGYNTAIVGNNPQYKKECYAIFGCGTPFESDVGTGAFINGNKDKARKLMKEAGYDGRKVVILDPANNQPMHSVALLTAQTLREIGVAADVQAMDWATLTQRRVSKKAPGASSPGWNIFPTMWPTITMSNPITNIPLDASGDSAWYGWPNDEEIERLRSEFVKAATIEEQKKVTEALQKRFYEFVPYITTGQFMEVNAWRSNLKGVVPFMQLVFWNIEKK